MSQQLQTFQRLYRENQYLFSPFSPIDNTNDDKFHTDLVLQNNKEKFQQLLKEEKNIFISHWLFNQTLQKSLLSYLTYRSRPIDTAVPQISSAPADLFEYDRLVFQFYAHVTELSFNPNQEIYESIPLFRLPSLISLGSIMGDSNLANFRRIFLKIHSRRPSMAQEFDSTISETEMTLEQLHRSLDATISTLQDTPKSKYLLGAAPQRQHAKTGSGIRAVNMKAKKAAPKESSAETNHANQLTSLSSFSDSLEFALDISYFLSILSSVSHSYLLREDLLSEIGRRYLSCIALLYELIIPLFDKGFTFFSSSEEQTTNWKRMIALCRNRTLQSIFITIAISCHSLGVPIPSDEIRSFPWLADATETTESGRSYDLPWSELIVQMISGEIVSSSFEGTLFGDLMKIYPQTMTPFLERVFRSEDEDKRSYLLKIIQTSAVTLNPTSKVSSHIDSKVLTTEKTRPPSPTFSVPTAQSLIQDVKAIFPDYGEFFISCVLEAYGQNPERAIDALLSENLPPNLQKMDRTTKSAWMGKSSTDSATAVSRKGNEIKYTLEMSAKDKEIQKMRVRQMEQRQEEDSRLMSLEIEYGDDYDDQYDEGGLKQPTHNWQEEREKILRVNKLIRSEEAEDAYWAGMANSNQKGSRVRPVDADADADAEEGNEEEEEDGAESKMNLETKAPHGKGAKGKPTAAAIAGGGDGGAPPSGRGPPKSKHPSKPAATASRAKETLAKENPKGKPTADPRTQSNTGQQRKPKTKTFDNHHQKDKSTKKYGGFM